MTRVHAVVPTPVGDLTAVLEGDALAGLLFDQHRHPWAADRLGPRDDAAGEAVAAQLAGYFAGERRAFDLPLALAGTPFQLRVWAALQDVPYGETRSYGEVAAALGLPPGASRAVGLANGRNPVSVVVPCHRVVGADGSLTGYGGGLDRKRALLDLERRHAAPGLW